MAFTVSFPTFENGQDFIVEINGFLLYATLANLQVNQGVFHTKENQCTNLFRIQQWLFKLHNAEYRIMLHIPMSPEVQEAINK